MTMLLAQEGNGVVPEEGQRKNPNAIKFSGGSAEVAFHQYSCFFCLNQSLQPIFMKFVHYPNTLM